MENALRYTGIDITGDIPWGTHFCQFYQTKEDLIDILVPYFKAGLENNEFCIWITSEPLGADEAHEVLGKALPNYAHYTKKGQIEIISYNRWYIRDGVFDPERVLNDLMKKLDGTLNKGYDGLRISGNTSWLEEENWDEFVDYEEKTEKILGNYKIIALCSYSLDKCNHNEVIDVVNNHQFFLIKHGEDWTLLDNRHKKTEEALKKSEETTKELQTANKELQQQRNELKRIAQRDEAILSSMGEGLIITDNNDQISFINHTAKQILGFESLNDVNQTMKEFGPVIKTVYPDGTEIPLGKCPSSRAKRQRFSNLEVKVKRIDKPIEFIGSCNGAPIINNGEIMGSVLTFRDITKLKTTQEELEFLLKNADEHRDRLQTVIDNLPVGLWIADENGAIVLVNDIAIEILGAEVHTLEEYKKFKKWWADTGEEIHKEELPLIQALNGNSLKEVVVEVEKPNGTHGTNLISAVPIKDSNSKITGSIAIVQDITELKKSEKYMQELLEKEHRLREKLQISNLELNRTKNILEETVRNLENSNADLEQFAYVASHDLQEPLRMVASFTQLLEKRYKDKLDEDADDYIGFIVDGAQRMKDLIDDLLAFSRLNTEAEEFKETNLETVLNDVLITLKSSIEENDVGITYNNLPTVMVDPTQINQLFQNLLSNAIKFRGNRSPKIHLDAEELEDEWKISISDDGIGISPVNQKRIFNVFTRLHTRQEYDGTGIGLSICKRIVQRHGGQIWVESEIGKGATFYFTIPRLE